MDLTIRIWFSEYPDKDSLQKIEKVNEIIGGKKLSFIEFSDAYCDKYKKFKGRFVMLVDPVEYMKVMSILDSINQSSLIQLLVNDHWISFSISNEKTD